MCLLFVGRAYALYLLQALSLLIVHIRVAQLLLVLGVVYAVVVSHAPLIVCQCFLVVPTLLLVGCQHAAGLGHASVRLGGIGHRYCLLQVGVSQCALALLHIYAGYGYRSLQGMPAVMVSLHQGICLVILDQGTVILLGNLMQSSEVVVAERYA